MTITNSPHCSLTWSLSSSVNANESDLPILLPNVVTLRHWILLLTCLGNNLKRLLSLFTRGIWSAYSSMRCAGVVYEGTAVSVRGMWDRHFVDGAA